MLVWLKALHIVFVVTWFAGLFYLPRLFLYHAATSDTPGLDRFAVMERRLFVIMTVGGALAVLFGIAMIATYPEYLSSGWLRVKLILVVVLIAYHAWCRQLMGALRAGRQRHSARWYRWFNEIPSLLLLAIVILAVVKPSFG